MKALTKILTCEIKESDDKLDEREKAREKVLQAQRDMLNEKMADIERRRVNMDDINNLLKARLQKDIEMSEYELEKSKKNNIFEDPMIKAIRQKQVIFGNLESFQNCKIFTQEDEETTLERIRRKREERRRRDQEEQEQLSNEKSEDKAERDPAERRAKARAEREKLLQGNIHK